MLLNERNLAHYLLDRGLVSADSLVDGDFVARERAGRHTAFEVVRRQAPSFFVKQGRDSSPGGLDTFRREALFYQHLAREPALASLRPSLPRFYFWDPGHHVLVIELLEGAQSLGDYHRWHRRCPPAFGAALGRRLAACHGKAGFRARRSPGSDPFPRQLPPVLLAVRNASRLKASASPANVQMLGLLERFPSFHLAFDRLRAGWRFDRLIHGDVKWENFLVQPGSEMDLKVVDWEMVDLGDPCWDVGAVFQAYLSFWALCLPAESWMTPEQRIEHAPVSLGTMQPAMRAFWWAYAEAAALGAAAAAATLERSLLSAGARMVQTVYEHLVSERWMDARALTLLQLSLHVLTRPRQAGHDLVGL